MTVSAVDRRWPFTTILASATVIFAAITIASSYYFSISLSFCGATITTDEGACSLQIPLVRLAANHKLSTDATIYQRSSTGWESPISEKCTLDNWMAQSNEEWFVGHAVADFGYWYGSWQDDARPGPFLVMFVPIWFVFVAILAMIAAIRRYRVSWSLRLILACTLVAAVAIRLLTLRESIAE